MTVADGRRDRAVLRHAIEREIDGLRDEPDPRQPPAVPAHTSASVGDHLGFARLRHRAALNLLQVARRERQAVRRVAHQIGLDEHVRGDLGLVAVQTRAPEEIRRKAADLRGIVCTLGQVGRRLVCQEAASVSSCLCGP